MAASAINNQKTLQQIIDNSSKSTQDRKTGELGKDDFLNLLVTQLKYQDPLKPVDDKEFIGQMAQFSSLEQMQNMNTNLSQSQGFSLIGKHVTADIADDKTKETKTVEGDVTSVKVSKGKVSVVVNGTDIPIEKISDVTDGARSSNSNISQYTNLIGYEVKGAVYDSQSANIVGVNGVVRSVKKGAYEDYAVMDGVNAEISDIYNGQTSVDPDFRKNYLESNKGKQVSVIIADRVNDQKVAVTAVLRNYNITGDGKITATLDQLNVPVESIANITPVKQDTTSQQSTSVTASGNTAGTAANTAANS